MNAALALSLLLLPQGTGALAAVERAEQSRVETMARAARSVCAVMPVESDGGGSGVVIDPLGFVLTNFHVIRRGKSEGRSGPPPVLPDGWPDPRYPEEIENDDESDPAWKVMKVGLPDGELYLADVLGIDPGSDLAVLLLRPRLDGKQYDSATLGDSDDLLVGEPVFAMGNPFLLANDFVPTVTWGIVSGTHRYQAGGANRFLVYPDCIQVDAPVNPGNSGGPLFNEAGEVVGINGRISVRDRGRVNTGVGFAIASNQIRNFLGDLMAGRHAEHGTLDLNAWFMNSLDGGRRGVFVQAIFADSRAADLGVNLGAELTSFNGTEVRSANQLATLVGVLPAESWATLGFRPASDDGGYGSEREITFQLTRLDTGSSYSEDRVATEAQRRLARIALTRAVGRGETAVPTGAVVVRGAQGERVVLRRLGASLCRDDGKTSEVLDESGRAFVRDAAGAHDASPEVEARLHRIATTEASLWRGDDRRALVGDALLEGGVLVFGEPAFRFRLPGDGQREVFLHEDGTAAGCRYRDPVARVMLEYRFSRNGHARVLADGVLVETWEVEAPPAVSPDDFERSAR